MTDLNVEAAKLAQDTVVRIAEKAHVPPDLRRVFDTFEKEHDLPPLHDDLSRAFRYYHQVFLDLLRATQK